MPIIIIRTERKPVLTCKFKIGFLILLICLENVKILFVQLIETNLMKSTYRHSQVHLEFFFGCIRKTGGYSHYLNVIQFKLAYKKMLNHLEIKSAFRGNCTPLKNLNILTCTPDHCIKESYVSTIGYREVEEINTDEADVEKV